ncbi:MAG TPA: GTP cyclohydrolase II [Dongiaceae bacterium]|nr:GTP cyclohydrolase II [Dongiaceae bacterium]
MQPMNSDFQAKTAAYRATVERCLAELRRGGAIGLTKGHAAASLALAAEMVEEASLAALQSAAGQSAASLAKNGGALRLVLTVERATDLGLMPAGGSGLAIVRLPAEIGAEALRQLADPTAEKAETPALSIALADDLPMPLAEAAIDLAKAARLLPAALMIALPANHDALTQWVDETFTLDCTGLAAHQRALAGSLKRVGSARVPLEGAEETEIIAFRPADGGKEHLAIVIGRPDPAQPVLIRLHSECFTGDLLGSLRCDCGDQLRGAIETIAKSGSGIVLYLAQEGRGIGLINKLRAYRLQDAGADTLEANQQLGFGADERVYQPAAEMLRQLGFTAVRLLTNNPEKLHGLEQCGIRVAERVPHVFPSNDHNAQYLITKARRFGHMF